MNQKQEGFFFPPMNLPAQYSTKMLHLIPLGEGNQVSLEGTDITIGRFDSPFSFDIKGEKIWELMIDYSAGNTHQFL